MLDAKTLQRLYEGQGKSMQGIANDFHCSVHRIEYWMRKYGIQRRTISEAIYKMNNPEGDPFQFQSPRTIAHAKLFGLGIGLYWGEGTKANKSSVRLGNTDPGIIRTFMEFLVQLFGVEKADFRFHLQVFSDIDTKHALRHWARSLGVSTSQFTKTTVTRSGSIGTYRKKSQYGVVTLNYHNKKLRDLLMQFLPL